MPTSSFDPASTRKPVSRNQLPPSDDLVRSRLVDLASRSRDQREFFHHLTADLQTYFGAAIVILQSSDWSIPTVQSKDVYLLDHIERDALDVLLATSTPTPVSCDIPLSDALAIPSPRALRVELIHAPQRVSSLIVYSPDHRPSSLRQVDDLQQLQRYAEATRELIPNLPLNADEPVAVIHQAHSENFGSESRQRRALSSFHNSLDLSETCYRIANESRRILGCDRVTILVAGHSRYQVKCVSGVAVVDRRSNPIRAVEKLANAAVVLDRKLVMPGDEALPPQVQEPLDQYLDESGVTSAIMIPLTPQLAGVIDEDDSANKSGSVSRIQGILFLENFSGVSLEPSSAPLGSVIHEAGISLRNALEHQSIFGLTIWKLLGGTIRKCQTPMWIGAICLAAALLAAGFLWPVEHYVVATGTAEPLARRDLFAAVDGSVQQLHVRDGQHVAKGDLLIQLENPELENRAESLAGQIQTTAGRLASIQSVRLSGKDEASQSSRLVLEERQLESELANLRAQQQVLKLQLSELAVLSPIDGTVVAWQIERRLMGRPVNRGNLLCTVANPEGPWRLRLTVPEQNAGPVVDKATSNESLPVRFAIATMPEKTFDASLDELSFAARMDEFGKRVLDLNATVESASLLTTDARFGDTSQRVGADVTARIACGQRPLIRSWFSDVFDFVNRHILFRLR